MPFFCKACSPLCLGWKTDLGGQHWFDILLLDPVKRCAGQKTRLEYNGKKRKFLSVDSLYLMQTVCIDKGGLPFPQEKGFGIHMKTASPFTA